MAKCFSDIDFKLVKKKCNDCSCAADDIKGIKCADLELTGGYYLCRPCFLRSRDSYTYYYEVWGYCNKCNGILFRQKSCQKYNKR